MREALSQAIGWRLVEYVPYCGYRIRVFTLGDRVRDTSFAALSLMVWYAWARSENTWWNSVINPPPSPTAQRTNDNVPVLVRRKISPASATNALAPKAQQP